MPQIAQLAATYSSQLFWLLLNFGFVFLVIGRGMVPKVQGTLDRRQQQISDDMAAARAGSARADALEAEWRARENADRARARDIVAQATAAAAKENEARLSEADRVIADRINAADVQLGQSRTAALAQIEAVAADAAAQMAQRVAGVQVSPEAAAQATREALNHG